MTTFLIILAWSFAAALWTIIYVSRQIVKHGDIGPRKYWAALILGGPIIWFLALLVRLRVLR